MCRRQLLGDKHWQQNNHGPQTLNTPKECQFQRIPTTNNAKDHRASEIHAGPNKPRFVLLGKENRKPTTKNVVRFQEGKRKKWLPVMSSLENPQKEISSQSCSPQCHTGRQQQTRCRLQNAKPHCRTTPYMTIPRHRHKRTSTLIHIFKPCPCTQSQYQQICQLVRLR